MATPTKLSDLIHPLTSAGFSCVEFGGVLTVSRGEFSAEVVSAAEAGWSLKADGHARETLPALDAVCGRILIYAGVATLTVAAERDEFEHTRDYSLGTRPVASDEGDPFEAATRAAIRIHERSREPMVHLLTGAPVREMAAVDPDAEAAA